MAIIPMPASVRIKTIEWLLSRPAQVNRSHWTGRDQVVADPWHGRWSAEAELAPIVGAAGMLAWRSFLAKVKGRINPFRLVAVEAPQHDPLTTPTTIVNHSNTTVTALGGGEYQIEKTGGVNAVQDAGAVSSTGLAGDFLLTVRAMQTDKSVWVMTGTNPTASLGNADRTHMILFDNVGQARVYTSSGLVAGPFGYSAAQYWFIRRVGTTVTILSGATAAIDSASLVYTYVAASSATLFFDSSLFHSNTIIRASFTTTQLVTAASGGAAGASTLTLSSMPALLDGHMVTVPLASGNEQMVVLTANPAGNVLTFEPVLRAAAAIGSNVETRLPYALVALASSTAGWSASAGQVYGIRLSAEERY